MIQKAHIKSLLKMDELNSAQKPEYFGEIITVDFDKPMLFAKNPKCPDMFFWRGKEFHIAELLSQWQEFSRKGKYSHNMKDAHLQLAATRGSLGVGRFYFRVQTDDSRIFDIYYDRTIKNSIETGGFWVLFQELRSK